LRPAEHALVETSVAGERAKVEVRR
jgi:hypothetical protein